MRATWFDRSLSCFPTPR